MNTNPIEPRPPLTTEPFVTGIPVPLVFDDNPLDALLHGVEPIPPTPASVLELWERGLDRSAACASAVTAILLRSPDPGRLSIELEAAELCLRQAIEAKPSKGEASLAACWSGLGRIHELKKQNDAAEACYREALELQRHAPVASLDATERIVQRLTHLLEISNRQDEAKHLRNRLKADRLRLKEDESSLFQLRSIALEMFLAGQYDEAESIYRRLAEKRFELPSTFCHLARVYLMTDREADARREVEQAWAAQTAPPDYLLVRIQFLRTLLQMLAGEDWTARLVEFKDALSTPGAHLNWTMQPVLDHLKPRLGPEKFELLTAMIAAVSQQSKLSELQANTLWREMSWR